RGELPDERPVLRLRPHQRGLPDVTLVVVKVGGRVAAESAAAVLELAQSNAVCVVHGAGPQISAEMERAGVPVEFVGGRRVTTADGLAIVRRSFQAVNDDLCAAIG